MEIITSLEQLHKFSAPCVVALGTFDGLHRGHLDVIETAREKAHECNSQLAVFTFSNHPFEWIRPGMVPPALITGAQKQELLQQLLTLDNPYHCPHGRPTMIVMTKQELERKFKRIV